MKLTWKILIPLVVTATALIGVLIWQSVSTHINLLTAKDVAELENFYSLFTTVLEEDEEKMLTLSDSIANMPDVQQALAERDRAELARLLMPSFQALKEKEEVSAMAFHVPPATAFLLLHQPEKYDFDVSSFRPTVVAVNAEQKPIAGAEPGMFGLPIRGMTPISYQGNHIGLVDCTEFVGLGLLEQVKERIGSDLAIYVPEAMADVMSKVELGTDAPVGFMVYASTTEARLPVEASLYQKVMSSGERPIVQVSSQGHNYTVMLAPLLDYEGNVTAVVEFVVSRDALLGEIARSRNMGLLYGAILTVVSSLVLWQIVLHIITGPIGHLTEAANKISRGDFDVPVEVTSKDEIGELAKSIKRMQASLEAAIERLRQRGAAD